MTTSDYQTTSGIRSSLAVYANHPVSGTHSILRLIRAVGIIVALAGCASGTANTVRQIDRLESVDESPKVLVMEPDIKYYLLTAGGIPEPHAEWTTSARKNFADALKAYAEQRGTQVIMMTDNKQLGTAEIAYSKLHAAVGLTIQVNYYGQSRLPSKEGGFDWGLGPGVAEIGDKYNADYALFSYYRDYEASGGRVAFAVLAALAGVAVSTGAERGFASLVDLNTGEIVWFNVIYDTAGELRDEEGARTIVAKLFANMPER